PTPSQPVARPQPRPSQPVASPQPSPSQPVARPQPSPRPNRPVAQPSQPNITPPTVTVPDQQTGKIPDHLIDHHPSESRRRATNQYVDPSNHFNPRTADNNQPNESPSRTTANNGTSERPTVVLNERQTGCRTVVRNGRLASGSCSTTVATQPSKPSRENQNVVTRSNPTGQSRSNTRIASAAPTSARTSRSRSGTTHLKAVPVPSPQEMVALKRQLGERFSEIKTKVQEYGLDRMAYPNNGNRALLFPLPVAAQITSAFGWRIHPIFGDWRMHTGTDIAAPLGTPVLAAFQGEVAIADYVGGYGNMVVLRHEESTQESRYAHLKQILVEPGQWVEQGQVIGLVGSTGNSTGAHLHFEWRHNMAEGWIPVDAGPHLEWAMTAMLEQMEQEMAEEEVKIGMTDWNFPLDDLDTLGEIVLGTGTLFFSDFEELAEIDRTQTNRTRVVPKTSG
ncbi:peptidoglycan DD-metalloendopeptidase family protein, partial [Spirulina sp. CS-785/01]|uniref:M23 family metallopeptidase n=1 Tax=Spirulina sp. CS-785/01 TaxID=3021716 RepID=UPI0023305075